MRRRYATLLTLLPLVGLVAVPVVLTWREVRQEQLNHALIAVVIRNDLSSVYSLLKQGADANARNASRLLWGPYLIFGTGSCF